MINIITDYSHWKIDDQRIPIIKNTQEAFLLAHFIHNLTAVINRIIKARRRCAKEFTRESSKPYRRLQYMMNIAVKGQLYRECLNEVDRIKHGEGHNIDFDNYLNTGQIKLIKGSV